MQRNTFRNVRNRKYILIFLHKSVAFSLISKENILHTRKIGSTSINFMQINTPCVFILIDRK